MKNNDDTKDCPSDISWMTLDRLAECYDGVPRELYTKLWEITAECERARTARPLGGDGSDGTTEEPIIGGYANELGRAWHRFTDEERATIIRVTEID